MDSEAHDGATELGRGRSGIVYRMRDAEGREIARKIFVGDAAAKLVHYVFFGAPNPYTWNEDAIRCALLRREIVGDLVEHWFGSALEVADGLEVGWHEETRSYMLDTRFVDGRPVALHHPFSADHEGQSRDLRKRIMRPLQARLAEAGLDGLVWQAGRGNPVAANNFLRVGVDPSGDSRWAWIDLESGVPALIPINPLDLLLFYLPKSWRHRRPLFDDVEVKKLRAYVSRNRGSVEQSIGHSRCDELLRRIELLETHQQRWRQMRRAHRSIQYRLGKGEISPEEAEWYRARPLTWYARETRRALGALLRGALWGVRTLVRWVLGLDYLGMARAVWLFVVSQKYRAQLAHALVASRIDRWEARGQLEAAEATNLRGALRHEGIGSYITDFGVHVGIKPAIKSFQWGVLPALFAAGVLGPVTSAVLLVFGGMIGRTAYTLGRIVQATLSGERPPWVALVIGLLPVIGNAAYPVEIVYRGAEREGKLAGFILYDTTTTVGEMVPIWGGRDTGIEHRTNHLSDLVVRDRHPVATDASAEMDPRVESIEPALEGNE
jgi:hypothetical protein